MNSWRSQRWVSPLPICLRQPSRARPGARRVTAVALLFCAGTLAGCQAPGAPSGPTEIILRIPDREAFLDASLSLLRRYDLQPDRVDREHGLIVTQRTTSGQWFEPWRIDSQGAYQVLEASLHTIGRTVTITVEPVGAAGPEHTTATAPAAPPAEEAAPAAAPPAPATAPGDQYRVTVRVDKERFSAPERQITTASGALGIYSERIPTTEGLRRAAGRTAIWVPLGRDALLEGFLLARLLRIHPDLEPVD